MNKTEIATIRQSLTKPQRDVLWMLDGRFAPLDLNGTYKRVCVSLRDKGLIHFTESHKTVSYGMARGSHMWNKGRLVIRPRLSVLGADFIYNGGLDH
jgi:hypothetical protein